MSDEEQIRGEKVLAKIRERAEEQRKLEEQIPLHRNKHRLPKRVSKSELWTRDQKLELAKLADDFLEEAKAKAGA
jgi:hypothetical protein